MGNSVKLLFDNTNSNSQDIPVRSNRPSAPKMKSAPLHSDTQRAIAEIDAMIDTTATIFTGPDREQKISTMAEAM